MFKIKIDSDPKKPKLDVLPELKSVLLAVYNKAPSLTFEVTRDNSDRIIDVGDTSYHYKVNVFQGFQDVGYVLYTKFEHRGEHQWVYTVYSNNIKNKRGARHGAKTVNAVVAVKKILEYFKASPVNEVAMEVHRQAEYCLDSLFYDADMAIRRQLRDKDKATTSAISYVVGVRTGVQVDVPNFYMSELLPEVCNTYEIVKNLVAHSENNNTLVIKQMRDGTVMLVDQISKTTNQVLHTETYRTKEEVPSPYVDKMNMLSFVEPKQPVRDIGVRWDDEKTVGLYLIVKGDIITDS